MISDINYYGMLLQCIESHGSNTPFGIYIGVILEFFSDEGFCYNLKLYRQLLAGRSVGVLSQEIFEN